MSNIVKYPNCDHRTELGNCGVIGGFCTSVNESICDAFHKLMPKHGEWIFKTIFPNDKSEFPMGYLVCSVCGSHHSNSTPCNYCDNCGARMKGADDDL